MNKLMIAAAAALAVTATMARAEAEQPKPEVGKCYVGPNGLEPWEASRQGLPIREVPCSKPATDAAEEAEEAAYQKRLAVLKRSQCQIAWWAWWTGTPGVIHEQPFGAGPDGQHKRDYVIVACPTGGWDDEWLRPTVDGKPVCGELAPDAPCPADAAKTASRYSREYNPVKIPPVRQAANALADFVAGNWQFLSGLAVAVWAVRRFTRRTA